MAHICKCVYCGQQFDRDKIPFVTVRPRRYAHKSCADGEGPPPKIIKVGNQTKEVKTEINPTLIDKEKLNKYLYELYNGDYDYAKTALLIESYIKKYKYTYSGIRKALIYFYEVKGNPIELDSSASRSIGIIPYVYDEAKRYYYDLWKINENNAKLNIEDYKPKEVKVKISNPTRKINKRKKFTFLDEEAEENS